MASHPDSPLDNFNATLMGKSSYIYIYVSEMVTLNGDLMGFDGDTYV